MIQLSSLSKSFGDRVLLDAVTWQIDDRERVGLSGPNGAGKTTLLRMLAGLEDPDGGLIVKPSGLTIGYLPQDGLAHSGRTLRAEASMAFKPLLEALHRLQTEKDSPVRLRTALVTARSAPAHERAVRTLMEWNIAVDEAMFLGGLDKGEFLRSFEPDFYFDDQYGHIDSARAYVAAGHVPFGVRNLR